MPTRCPDCGSDNIVVDPRDPDISHCLDCGAGFNNKGQYAQYNLLTQKRSYSHIKKEGFSKEKHFTKAFKDPTKWIILVLGVILGSFINGWFVAGVALLFVYLIFPTEFKILNAAEEEYFKHFPQATQVDKQWIDEYMNNYGHIGLIGTSYICKFGAIILFAIAFSQIYLPLVLVVLFIGYFSFPGESEKKNQISDAIRGYVALKPLFGIIMAYEMWMVLDSVILGIMTVAFFVFIPQKKNINEELTQENVANALIFLIPMLIAAIVIYSPFSITTVIGLMIIIIIGVVIAKISNSTKVLLLVFSIAILLFGMISSNLLSVGWGLSLDSTVGILVGTIWFVSLLSGLSSTPASRPYVGMIMIPILFFAYAVVFPATVGTAVFGAWWPTVDSAITSVTAPLGTAWEQASSGMGSAFSMVTNPSAYYEQQMAQQQASANIKSGGTTKSIEVGGDFLINNVPEQALLASATLENQGEFKATNINVILNQLQMKSKDKGILSPQPDVAYKFATCSGVTPSKTNSDGDTCKWPDPSYNGDMKLMTFTYGDKNVWGDIGKCDCAVGSDKSSCIPTTDDINGCKYCYADAAKTKNCADNGGVVEYPFAGKTISVGFGYSFDYIVNVSLGLQLMQSETLNDLLLKKQIRLQDVEAQYSGGPVRASIWTMKQPVRANEDTLAVITILNQGTGTVKNGAEYVLTIPFVSGMNANDLTITEVSSSGLNCGDASKIQDGTTPEKYSSLFQSGDKSISVLGRINKGDSYELRCKLDLKNGDLAKGKDVKYGFIFNYNIPKTVDSKTVLFVGNVNYQYQNSYAKETQITWVPPQ